MNKFLNSAWFWSILILVLIIAVFYFMVKKWIDNIQFKPNISGIDFSSLLNFSSEVVPVSVKMTVNNKNSFRIPVKDLNFQLFYKDQLIAESSKNPNNIRSIIVYPKVDNSFIHIVDINKSQEIIRIASQVIQKQPITLQYIVKGTIYNIPITYIDEFKIN